MRISFALTIVGIVSIQSPSGQEPLTWSRQSTFLASKVVRPYGHRHRGQRLFVAALGNNTVEVLDVKEGLHLKSLPGFREPQGIAFLPDLKLAVVANGQGDGVQIDADNYRVAKSARLGDDPTTCATSRRRASVRRIRERRAGGGRSRRGQVLGQAKLAGHPESFQLERSGPRAFVNVPNADQIAVVDRTAMKVMASWPVTSAKSNYPMALDEANHRLFVGCRRPAKVARLRHDHRQGSRRNRYCRRHRRPAVRNAFTEAVVRQRRRGFHRCIAGAGRQSLHPSGTRPNGGRCPNVAVRGGPEPVVSRGPASRGAEGRNSHLRDPPKGRVEEVLPARCAVTCIGGIVTVATPGAQTRRPAITAFLARSSRRPARRPAASSDTSRPRARSDRWRFRLPGPAREASADLTCRSKSAVRARRGRSRCRSSPSPRSRSRNSPRGRRRSRWSCRFDSRGPVPVTLCENCR